MNKRWALLSVLLLLSVFALGCEAKSRYRVLSFLFDGVPVPKGMEPVGANGKALTAKALTDEADLKRRYTEHGPYAAKMCEGCHQRQTNKLLMPVEDLCQYCHVFNAVKKHVHGPLASGGCVVCHNAHGSGNKYLLVADSAVFCLYCHKQEDILKKDVHRNNNTACTDCHNAHASDNEFLLLESPGSNPDVSPWGQPEPKRPTRTVAKDVQATNISVAK